MFLSIRYPPSNFCWINSLLLNTFPPGLIRDQADLTQTDLIQADLTQGRVDPHSDPEAGIVDDVAVFD